MKKVIIESPFSGNVDANIEYAKKCMIDCISRGEAPFASHLFYPLVLNDDVQRERDLGMQMGFLWMESADLVAVYTDRGRSRGMDVGILRATKLGLPIEFRSIVAGVKVDA